MGTLAELRSTQKSLGTVDRIIPTIPPIFSRKLNYEIELGTMIIPALYIAIIPD